MTLGIWGEGPRWALGIQVLSAPSDVQEVSLTLHNAWLSSFLFPVLFLFPAKNIPHTWGTRAFSDQYLGPESQAAGFVGLWQRSGNVFFCFRTFSGPLLLFLWFHCEAPVPSLSSLLVSHKCAVACVTHLCCLLWHDFCVTWLKISVCERSKWTAAAQGVEWLLQWYEGRWFKSTCCT